LSLWLHENSRVFEDRLTCGEDHAWFRQHQVELLHKHFDLNYSKIVTQERLIYGDYLVPGAEPKVRWSKPIVCPSFLRLWAVTVHMHGIHQSSYQQLCVCGARYTSMIRKIGKLAGLRLCCVAVASPLYPSQVYSQVQDMPGLVRLVESYLEDYNSTSTSPMKLVLFLDAIEHVSRICRIIRQPLGNALLLGVGGSGRQSLARLAAFMCDYEVVQIEIAKGYGNNEWREVRWHELIGACLICLIQLWIRHCSCCSRPSAHHLVIMSPAFAHGLQQHPACSQCTESQMLPGYPDTATLRCTARLPIRGWKSLAYKSSSRAS
jgi:hypothetical protein